MSQQNQNEPKINLTETAAYRESYANSVQVRMSVWDFQLVFGTIQQSSAEEVSLQNFQAIYVSPQQAKALVSVLAQNLAQYEQAFGKINLDAQQPQGVQQIPVPQPGGPVN